MDLGYLEFIIQWPLILAAVISFFAIKAFLFKGNKSGKIFDHISEKMVTNTIKDSARDGERELQHQKLLSKARNIEGRMYMLRGEASKKIGYEPEELNLELNNWQKAVFGWTLVWFGITIFFIVETFLDPANWGNNWALLPYFIYYIAIGVIYVFKR